MITFTTWLSRQRKRDDAVSDLANDVARDRDWPRPNTLKQMLSHLRRQSACADAMCAAERAWSLYTQEKTRMIAAKAALSGRSPTPSEQK